MDLISPISQVDGNAELTASPADSVPVDVAMQSKGQEEAGVDEAARPRSAHNQATPDPDVDAEANADASEAPAEASEQPEPSSAAYDSSKFAPINAEDKTAAMASNGTEPEDEIVVGTRAKKAAAVGFGTPKTADKSKNDNSDDEPRVRMSKRKRTAVRYSRLGEDDSDLDDEEYADTSRTGRKPTIARGSKEKSTERHGDKLASAEEPVPRASKKPKVFKSPVVPLDAPTRPATRWPLRKKRRSSTNNNNNNNSPSNSGLDTDDDDGNMEEITTPKPDTEHGAMGPPPVKTEPEAQPAPDKIRILLGYWKNSDEEDPANKHAVVGVLGANKQLRPRLIKEDRFGNTRHGNHPPGAGGVWRNWDEIVFEPHIAHLTRNQLKEYVAIRQVQMAAGETPQAVEANQIKAVKQAEDKVAAGTDGAIKDYVATPAEAKKRASSVAPATPEASAATPDVASAPEAIKATPTSPVATQKRVAHFPGLSVPPKNAKRPKRTPTVEEINERASMHVAKAEVIQQRRNSQRVAASNAAAANSANSASSPALSAAPSPTPSGSVNTNKASSSRRVLDQAMGGMQRNWAAQAELAARDGIDDAKVYLGARYSYQTDGYFEGLYATTSTIIKIGDEEFVENRVLRPVGPPVRR